LEVTSFLSSFVNESALKLKKIFKEMETPCIVFIDEIDSIAQKRTPDSKDGATLINTLLQEMDGFSEKKNILFIAATNRLESLDPAILRSGRFDLKILVDYPDLEGREGLFEFYVRKYEKKGKKSIFSTDLDLELFAKLSEKYTGADVAELLRRVVSDFASRSLEEKDARKITTDDILKEMMVFDTERGDTVKRNIGFKL
jgi:transitional endoplasmic reticulum ATPase